MHRRLSLPACLQAFVRPVIAAVRHPDNVQLIRRIVQLKAVLHLLVHHLLFVESRDKQRHLRQFPVRCRERASHWFHEKLFQLDKDVKQDSVAQIRVEHNKQGKPEKNFETKSKCIVHDFLAFILLDTSVPPSVCSTA